MSDARLRELERVWRASGDPVDEERYLRERLRALGEPTGEAELRRYLANLQRLLAMSVNEVDPLRRAGADGLGPAFMGLWFNEPLPGPSPFDARFERWVVWCRELNDRKLPAAVRALRAWLRLAPYGAAADPFRLFAAREFAAVAGAGPEAADALAGDLLSESDPALPEPLPSILHTAGRRAAERPRLVVWLAEGGLTPADPGRPSLREDAVRFFVLLAAAMANGVRFNDALSSLGAWMTTPRMQEAIEPLAAQVEQGLSLEEALLALDPPPLGRDVPRSIGAYGDMVDELTSVAEAIRDGILLSD